MKIFDEIKTYVVFAFILIGIAGLSMDMFKSDGMLAHTLGVVWDAEVSHPMLIVPTIGGILLAVSIFLRGGINAGKVKSNRLADVPTYIFMAAGAWYAFQWLWQR